jgi:predicted nucleotidyltransferase
MDKIMHLKGLSQEEEKELIPKDLIFLGYRGSIAHGMYISNSDPNSIDDKDIMGVYLAKPSHYIGINQEKETIEKKYKEWDCVYYELRKLLNLLIKGNPNVLSLLWLDNMYILHTSDIWKQILENKDAFVSKNVYHSFCGYAHGQLHRMTHFKFEGYMGEKRKALVDKYGFDCKNGSHLIRILKMGIEFLTEGRLYVKRTIDATQLLEIKRGEWPFEQVVKESDRLFKLCEEAYVRSSLPAQPDRDKIDKLCMSILSNYLVKYEN